MASMGSSPRANPVIGQNCDYYVFIDSSNIVSAENCTTGQITFGSISNAGGISGSNAALVIGNAINSSVASSDGGRVELGQGNYTLTGAIDLYEGVWLQGSNQGWTTTPNGAVLKTTGNFPAVIFKNHNGRTLMGHISDVMLYGSNNIAFTNNVGISNIDSSSFDWYADHVAISLFYTGYQCTSGGKFRMQDSTIEGNLKYGININSGYLNNFHDIYLRTNGLGNAGYGAFVTNPTQFQFENSQVIGNNAGMVLQDTVQGNNYQFIIVGNTFMDNTGSNRFNFNLELYQGDSIITGNIFSFDSTIAKTPGSDILLFQSKGIVTSNFFQSTSAITTFTLAAGTPPTTIIRSNDGYNPTGKITNFLIGGRSGVTSHSIGALGGNSSIEVASTIYTETNSDCYITSADSSNSNNAILIKDAQGNSLLGNAVHTLTAQWVPAGYTITWGAFTGTAGVASVFCN